MDWQDTAYRLVLPLQQVTLAQLYKSPSMRQCDEQQARLKAAFTLCISTEDELSIMENDTFAHRYSKYKAIPYFVNKLITYKLAVHLLCFCSLHSH